MRVCVCLCMYVLIYVKNKKSTKRIYCVQWHKTIFRISAIFWPKDCIVAEKRLSSFSVSHSVDFHIYNGSIFDIVLFTHKYGHDTLKFYFVSHKSKHTHRYTKNIYILTYVYAKLFRHTRTHTLIHLCIMKKEKAEMCVCALKRTEPWIVNCIVSTYIYSHISYRIFG